MIRGHFDGASRGNPGQAGAGAVIYDGDKVIWRCARPLGTKTNNEAEYMALAILADELTARGLKGVEICGDSKLVISQISGQWKIKEPRLHALALPVMKKLAALGATYKWVRRELNAEADRMSNKALDDGDFVEDLASAASGTPPLSSSPAKTFKEISSLPPAAEASQECPGSEAPLSPVMSVKKAGRHIWLVEDGGVQYAVDMAHNCCSCQQGRKNGRCVHVERILCEDPFPGKEE